MRSNNTMNFNKTIHYLVNSFLLPRVHWVRRLTVFKGILKLSMTKKKNPENITYN